MSKIEKVADLLFLYLILSFYYGKTDTGQFKQSVHSYFKTYLDRHEVSSLAGASTMADDYALTHICFFFDWNIKVSTIWFPMFRIGSYLITILINQNQIHQEKWK